MDLCNSKNQRFRQWYDFYGNEIELYEGLIKTMSIVQSVAGLKRKWPSLKISSKHTMRGLSNDFSVTIDLNKIKDIEEILKMLNMLGWFISVVLFSREKQPFLKLNKNINIDSIAQHLDDADEMILYVEAKFDLEITKKEFPSILYHVTPKKFETKIRKFGLVPKSSSEVADYPERIYFAYNEEDARTLLYHDLRSVVKSKEEKFPGEFDEWLLLTINTQTIRRLFRDPNYEYGLFTFSNIPPSMIKNIEDL